MRRLITSLFLLLGCSALFAQSCTLSVCNAATPNESDVLAALPASGNTNATVVVNIPSGASTWASALNYSVPSAVTNLTIQGATTVNCTGTAGQSSWSCPATDLTVITDGFTPNGQNQLIQITTGPSSTSFRWTGTTLKPAANAAKNNGLLYIVGNSHNVRIDHNHIDENGQTDTMIRAAGSTLGVADHNLFSLGTNSSVGNGFQDFASSDGTGDAAWSSATNWGTTSFWYLESDYFEGGSPTDCYNGGKLVIRYSTIHNIYVMALHGTKNDAGRGRSCRATEIYHLYGAGTSNSDAVVGQNGGTSMIWGNNIASGFNRFNAPGSPRNFSGGDVNTPTPNGWGLCGPTLGPSNWDGNQTNGYPCLDGVGRGQGDPLSGNFPSVVDSLTGTITWPNQMLEPEYMWMNTLAAANEGGINDTSSQYNRDVYPDCGNAGSVCSGSFNGTQGTGFGNHSVRPTTCTPGPGGTYGTSPTGSYGPGYWELDTNTFFVCDGTSANHWQAIYTPLVYPHPLAGGTPQANAPTFSPSTGIPPQTVTMSCSTGGSTGCYTTDGSSPTAPTPGTCSGGTTLTYSSPISVSANPTTINGICTEAAFTNSSQASSTYSGSNVCGDPTQVGPNFSNTYTSPPTTLPLNVQFSSPTAGCTMHATTDGSTPTCASTTYPGGGWNITVAGSYTYRVIACQTAYTSSNVIGGNWILTIAGIGPPTNLRMVLLQ